MSIKKPVNKIEKLIDELCPDGVPACRQAGSLGRISNPNFMPKSKENTFYAYVLECENGALYKGFTTYINQRYIQHLTGKGAKYTRAHKPICLFYYEIFNSEKEALEREIYLKSGSASEVLKQLQGLI